MKNTLRDKLFPIINAVAATLEVESAYKMVDTCNRYSLGDGSAYSSPSSKMKFLQSLIGLKEQSFIIELAKRVMTDYHSDAIGMALNNYYDGRFFKLSLITRKELLKDLLGIGDLSGMLTQNEFLKQCKLDRLIIPEAFTYLSSLLNINAPGIDTVEKDLGQTLIEGKIDEMLDEHFFYFLERIVHPYTRKNKDADQYLKIINKHLNLDGLELVACEEISGESVFKVDAKGGVYESVKNLIFASNGYKPEIVLDDAISNRVKIMKNAESCLIYERPIKSTGLLWDDLMEWWSGKMGQERSPEIARALKNRLFESLASEPERILFNSYYQAFSSLGVNMPALIPQVYLHYDPYSIKQYGLQYLLRQRMDFLMLLSSTSRIVIEVDGKQHYAEGENAAPKKYAEMVSLDRELKLLGYEVYRFGGYELTAENKNIVVDFFQKLFSRHGIEPQPRGSKL